MPDLRLVQSGVYPYQSEVSVDWLLLNDGTLDDTQALATAVIVALGTDRLADADDLLPDPDSTDRRGWWGDFDAETIWQGWPIGCRLWLMYREKITGPNAQRGATVARIEQYVREAIQPFLDMRIASHMQLAIARIDTQRIDVLIQLYRGPELAIDLRYQILWEGIQP